jgi:hypothetical protein
MKFEKNKTYSKDEIMKANYGTFQVDCNWRDRY